MSTSSVALIARSCYNDHLSFTMQIYPLLLVVELEQQVFNLISPQKLIVPTIFYFVVNIDELENAVGTYVFQIWLRLLPSQRRRVD